MALMMVAVGATYFVVVALKPIAADFGWPRSVPSFAYSLSFVGFGLGGLLMGYWSDRVGMGPPALLGAAMVGAGMILAGLSAARWQFYLAHGLLIGVFGVGALFSPLLANVTRWFTGRRGLAVAMVISGQSLAGVVWPPIARYLIDAVGWRQAFVAFGTLAVCVMVPLALMLRRRPPGESGASRAAARDDPAIAGLHPNRVLALLSLAIVCCCVPMALPMVHMVAHATDLGFAPARGAEILSLMLLAAFVARLVAGWVADRIGPLTTLLVTSSWQAAMLLAYLAVDGLPGLYVTSLLFGLGFGGIIPCYALIAAALFPSHTLGWRIAMVYLGGTLGMAVGGWMGGLVYDLTGGYSMAFLIGFAFNLVNLALVATLILRRVRPSPAAA